MTKRSKSYRAAAEKVHADVLYTPFEAMKLAKETTVTKFDSTVEVGHLGLPDLAGLVHGDRADLGGVGRAGALLDASGLLDHLRRGRGLEDEREGAVLVNRDLDGDDVPALRLGRGVVGLGELDDVHAVLAQSGADGRSGGGGAGCDLKLDQAGNLLLLRCH